MILTCFHHQSCTVLLKITSVHLQESSGQKGGNGTPTNCGGEPEQVEDNISGLWSAVGGRRQLVLPEDKDGEPKSGAVFGGATARADCPLLLGTIRGRISFTLCSGSKLVLLDTVSLPLYIHPAFSAHQPHLYSFIPTNVIRGSLYFHFCPSLYIKCTPSFYCIQSFLKLLLLDAAVTCTSLIMHISIYLKAFKDMLCCDK